MTPFFTGSSLQTCLGQLLSQPQKRVGASHLLQDKSIFRYKMINLEEEHADAL